MDIAVQWVRVTWTKRSRGAEAATIRNALPVAFTLPDAASLPVVHDVVMPEREGFAARESLHGRAERGVRLREIEGHLLVRPPDISSLQAMPPRRRRPPAVRLAPGEWLRWQLNHRCSSAAGMADWFYEQNTLNIAYGPHARDVFLGTPTRHVDERGYLR
ncbi:hypothetical protein IPZ58_23215 [Streptomyces roseoverticillatus]|uniref:hypothetical protein n=1 Tax=Streptomyces roseoverticillatus TaxID=66429 RepID=UPI001F43B632|nr:hypothetical protein [Streptomyces roseoverticillatus]MCF3104480.1 hypothetical protein [Streptomyces roseoverticillatus]